MLRYGWKPDLPDRRDRKFAPSMSLAALPSRVDLRYGMPPVVDQGNLNSCVGNAAASAVQYARYKKGLIPEFAPSRLFIYYFARRLQGWQDIDEGSVIRDAMLVLVADGVCSEDEWSYDESQVNVRPPQALLHNALQHKTTEYLRLSRGLYHFRSCLAQGFPFIFGFTVYDRFESDSVWYSGVLDMPGPRERVLGGHAVLCVGYSDEDRRFIVRNSWGKTFGQSGYFTMPYDYLVDEDLADDFWTVRISN